MGVYVDRLSSLPEPLLSAIVSSLSFQEAVRTSILSKNWVNICKSTTNIEFNELKFVRFDQSPENIDAQRRAFSAFTKKWIENRTEDAVVNFSLRISKPELFNQLINRCIEFAIRNGVKNLELDFTYPSWVKDGFYYDVYITSFDLPTCIYDYGRIEYLKLYSCNFITSAITKFHSLKEISLGYMKLSLCTIKTLLSNCEKLESISLSNCWSSDNFNLNEKYPKLKKLIINQCHFKLDILRVNAPNLRIFNYHGLMMNYVADIQSPRLHEANLDFSPEYGSQGHGTHLYNLMKEFISVRIMVVCSFMLQVIYTGGRPKRTHRKMDVRHLIMKTALHKYEFMGITFMLRSCCYLEHLTIDLCEEKYLLDYEAMEEVNPETFWIDIKKPYKCMRLSLKEIEIMGFKGTENEISVVSYLITNGKALRKMSIKVHRYDLEEEAARKVAVCRKAVQYLMMLPTLSSHLEMRVYW
ncbi:hypothetical protein RYX36_006832 [Vicia faba]